MAGKKSVDAKDAENGKKARKGNQDHTMNRKPGGGEFRNWASPIFFHFSLCTLWQKDWLSFAYLCDLCVERSCGRPSVGCCYRSLQHGPQSIEH